MQNATRKRKKGKRGRRRPRASLTSNRTLPVRTTRAPVSTGQVVKSSAPLQSIRFRHREFITDVVTLAVPVSWEYTQSIAINPGLESSCPWLARLGVAFEKYRFHDLRFHYVPTCPSTFSGYVLMAPDYDSKDDNSLLTKGDLLAFGDSGRASIWQSFTVHCTHKNYAHPVERYLRHNAITGAHDIKTYDVCNLEVRVGGTGQVSYSVGEIWIEYDVELITPQLNHDQVDSVNAEFTPTANDNPFQGADFQNNTLGYVVTGSTPLLKNRFEIDRFEGGKQLINMLVTGTGLASGASCYNPQLFNAVGNDTIDVQTITGNAGGTVANITSYISMDPDADRTQPLEFGWQGLSAGTMSAIELVASQLNHAVSVPI